jgi:hypothetical protein
MLIIRWFFRAASFVLVLSAVAGPAMAGAVCPSSVPVIDPGSILSAVTLLFGGLMMLTDRRRAR